MLSKSQSITLSTQGDNAKRRQLTFSIRKKRLELKKIILENETLRVNLDMARQEYMVKVGALFLKDNTLDLEIIRLQNIIKLMDEGNSYAEAVEEIARTYYAEQLELEQEKAKIQFEEEIFTKREEHKPLITPDLKKLWKKLIAKFHPDLTQSQKEKKKRTEIVMQINRAYEEGDYNQLMKIEQEHSVVKETTIENLEDILLNLLREVDEQKQTFKELRASEWYGWMIKIESAKKRNVDIFADTERRLLDDIVAKLDLITSLKKHIQEKEKEAIVL